MRFYNNRLFAINLCRLALGDQTVKKLTLLASKFQLDQSQRKSTQGDASELPNETQVERKSKKGHTLKVTGSISTLMFIHGQLHSLKIAKM